MPKKVWIHEGDEQGSFCDRESGNQYNNGDIFEASRQETNAHDRGEEVIWVDASIDSDQVYEVAEDQRFNIRRTEEDSQGVNYEPKYSPGR